MARAFNMKPPMHEQRRVAAVLLMAGTALTLLACTSVGTESGMLERRNSPVPFTWTSADGGISGTMSAVISTSLPAGVSGSGLGGEFNGPFLQVTSSNRPDAYEPLWRGWRRGWNDWEYWGLYPETAFTTHYSGKVIANLTGPSSQLLRCRFHLNIPAAGMQGGGQGECQFNGGRTVDAMFPRT